MNAIAQIQPSPALAGYQAFLSDHIGLHPTGFRPETGIQFSTQPNGSAVHTCLYVPHLSDDKSPIHELFFDSEGNQKQDANGKTKFASTYIRLQKTVKDVVKGIPKSITKIRSAATKYAEDEKTYQDKMHAGIFLSSIPQTTDSIERVVKLFMRSAGQAINFDTRALLTELAYAVYMKCLRENHVPKGEYRDRLKEYSNAVARAWKMSLTGESRDGYRDVRIFAGMRACFAEDEINLVELAYFLDQLYLLCLGLSIEDDLRMAFAKLVKTEVAKRQIETANRQTEAAKRQIEVANRQIREAQMSASQKMLNAITTWESRGLYPERVAALKRLDPQVGKTAFPQMQVW